MAASPPPALSSNKVAQLWRPVERAVVLVTWGLWAVGMAAGTAWAAPAGTRLSCGAPDAQPALAGTLNAGGAQITLNRSQGTSGTKLLVHGTGWPARAQIALDEESNGRAILATGMVVAAADGTFESPPFGAATATCGFDPSPGLVVQIVARTTDHQVSAVVPFTYVASPPILTAGFSEGSVLADMLSVPVEGPNWDAGTIVTLWSSPQSALAQPHDLWQPPAGAQTTQTWTDSQGNIFANVPLAPGLRPGTVIAVGAIATSARYGELATVLNAILLRPPVAPALSLNRTQGLAGASVTVSGSQYWPGDTVTIEYCRGAPQLGSGPLVRCNEYLSQALGQATVDSAGRFTARVTLPHNARTGPITFEAYATSSFVWMSDPYTLTAPFHIVAPAPSSWQRFATIHPRLARALPALAFGAPVVLCLAGAAWWIAARRRPRAVAPD
jgi:hypothetical protein